MSKQFPARLNVDDFATIDRRRFLRMLGASAFVTSAGLYWSRSAWADPVFSAYPFSLGVASGEPAPNGFVIWTRIAPKPLERGGGMPKKPVEVAWSVATDERMRDVVHKGSATAHPELGHAVHVELEGLHPARDYFYQFRIGSEQSGIGRARTLPPAGASVTQVRFAAAGCERYEDGYFTAYRRLAAERFDFVFHYGDYIHQNWAGELKKNFADEKSSTLGVEFVATSITSLGDGYDINDNFKAVLQKNPHMKFFNGQRGYVRHVVTPDRWQADYQVLDKVSVPDGRLSTRKSFIAENGRSALIDSAA